MSIDLIDPPVADMTKHELARRRAHLLCELEGHVGERSPRAPWRKAGLALALAAAIAVVAAVVPSRIGHHHLTLIDRALAAIGNGRMTHVIFVQRHLQVVDPTGKAKRVDIRTEIWADPKLGTVERSFGEGKLIARGFSPPGDDSQIDSLRPFVAGFRTQLKSGDFHPIGSGQFAGQPVEWIASTMRFFADANNVAHTAVQEIAISRTTYKPLYMRLRVDGSIRPDSGIRVVKVETLPLRRSLFAHPRPTPERLEVRFPTTAPRTTLRAARAAMRPDPIVPPTRLAGLTRRWVGLPRYILGPSVDKLHQAVGVELFYGRTNFLGEPVYEGPYISITELLRAVPILVDEGAGSSPQVVVPPSGRTAVFQAHGLYFVIRAGTTAEALAATRAVSR